MAAAKSNVNTVTALSTRTTSWWAFKKLAPGSAFTLFVIYALPAIYQATGR